MPESVALPLPDSTTPLLAIRMRALFGEVPHGLAGDAEAIHQMRVKGRRLRGALPLLAQKPFGKRVRRARRLLRELTRTAGASRDLDVAAGLLEKRAREADAAPELRLLLKRMHESRRRSRKRMAERLLDLDLARLRRDLRRILLRQGIDPFTAFGRLREMREKQGGALLAALDALGDSYDAPALHALRRRLRRLRYAAELQDELRASGGGAARALKALQDELGEVHDAHVLSGWLATRVALAERRGDTTLAAAAAAESRHFDEDSRRRHAALLATGLRARIAGALEELAPPRSAA